MCLAKNIRYLRKKNNLSQDDIANLLGYKSYTTIQKWEMGVSEPPIGKLNALAARFGVDINALATVDIEKAELQSHISSDPAQDYARLIAYLDSHPEHRQLVSDALKVRTEDIDMIRPLLQRCADPDSSAPALDTCKPSQGANSDTLDTLKDTSRRITLTDENLALVRDTPEVLAAEAEYIKKTSERPARRAIAPSPSTEGTGRKSG